MLEIAISIAVVAHTAEKDLGGDFYILHPLRVMAKMKSTDEKIVAVLHDVIEAGNNLEHYGFSRTVMSALDHISRRKGESYPDYIKRAAKNYIARRVKIADLEDNMDVRRLCVLTEKDHKRLTKYQEAWAYLMTC